MTKIKTLVASLVFVLALAMSVAATVQNQQPEPNKKESCCVMKDCCKDKDKSCCKDKDMACCKDKDCCKGDSCSKDGSNCCGDSCRMKHDKKDSKNKTQ